MKRIFLVMLLILWRGSAWGATFYVAKVGGTQWKYLNGVWPTAGTGTNTTDLETASAAVGANNTMVIEAGTYTGIVDLSAASLIFSTAGQTIRPPQVGDVDYPAHSGSLVFDGTGLTQYTTEINAANITLKNFRVVNTAPGYNPLWIRGSGFTVSGLILDTPQSGAACAGLNISGTSVSGTIEKSIIRNATDYAIVNDSTGTVNLNYSFVLGNNKGIRHNNGTLNINNTEIVGNGNAAAQVYLVSSNSQTLTLNNCTLGPVFKAGLTGSYQIQNATSNATVTANNCLIHTNWSTGTHSINYGTITLNNCKTDSRIGWKTPRRSGIVAIVVDDSASKDHAELIAQKAEAYGYRITWALNTDAAITATWTQALSFIARGHEISNHSKTHSTMAGMSDAQLGAEVYDSQTAIQTNLGGYTPTTFIYPGTSNDVNARAKVATAGFIGARAGTGATATVSFTSMRKFEVYGSTPGNAFGLKSENPTEAQIRGRVASMCEYANYAGGLVVIYPHDGTADYDFTSQSWDYFFDEVSKSGVRFMTFAAAMTEIANKAESTSGTGGELAYVRSESNLGDVSDYRLKNSSPCKNAGVSVGLTTDFLSKTIRGLPDIGAYELQPVQTGSRWGFRWGFR